MLLDSCVQMCGLFPLPCHYTGHICSLGRSWVQVVLAGHEGTLAQVALQQRTKQNVNAPTGGTATPLVECKAGGAGGHEAAPQWHQGSAGRAEHPGEQDRTAL